MVVLQSFWIFDLRDLEVNIHSGEGMLWLGGFMSLEDRRKSELLQVVGAAHGSN